MASQVQLGFGNGIFKFFPVFCSKHREVDSGLVVLHASND
jgi:hypothetical protein